jgi:hypothetical protein
LVTGLATGYYLGARAGRQRYDQINRTLFRIKRSDAFEQAAEQVKAVVEEGVEKARSLVDTREGNGQADPAPAPTVSDITGSEPPGPPSGGGGQASADPTEPGPPKGLGGYSSSR